MREPKGRYSRGYLPHIDDGQATQFVAFRLADSMPSSVMNTWRAELAKLPDTERKREMYVRIEAYLDAGHGSCVLGRSAAASAVQDTLLMYAQDRYFLHEWVVMLNHVHALLTPRKYQSLAMIMQSIKGHSARQVHAAIGGEGRLWQPDYFDRMIRDEEHFEKVGKYITWNPVKAGLCKDPTLWMHSSANARFRDDVSAD
ncbi:MAG: transposase [Chloroflexi bacterium]|nr:transposase [Chloroflexota bacterium]